MNQSSSEPQHITFYQRVYSMVKQIPKGKVMTYGQIAHLLGSPHAARAVGYALSNLPPASSVPWQRVVNSKGAISIRHPFFGRSYQKQLLEEENIRFNANDQLDLDCYRYHPL